VDAELSDGGEWGDLSELSSSEDESTTRQGGSLSFAATSTAFSFSTAAGDGSSSSNSSDGSSSSSDDDASESGLFGDPSMSIPPHLPVPLRTNRKPPAKVSTRATGAAAIGSCCLLLARGHQGRALYGVRPSTTAVLQDNLVGAFGVGLV